MDELESKEILNNQEIWFNPFGQLSESELRSVIVSRGKIDLVLNLLSENNVDTIGLIGKKGRGKSSLLSALSVEIENAQLIRVQTNDKISVKDDVKVLLVDGFYLLSLSQKKEILKNKNIKIIYAGHRNIYAPLISFFYRKHLVVSMKGLLFEQLQKIVNQRLSFSKLDQNNAFKKLSDPEFLKKLHNEFGDNLRAILNHLYHEVNLIVDEQ